MNTSRLHHSIRLSLLIAAGALALAACVGSASSDNDNAGKSSNAGSGGSAKGGSGNSGARSGSSGLGGNSADGAPRPPATGGTAGSAADAGSTGGIAGTGGTSGAGATGGAGGSAGSAGSAGSSGRGGAAGSGGAVGTGGRAGSAGVGASGGSSGVDGGPAPDCVRDVWNHLEACGWAGPTNTGYRAGTALKQTTGRTITADGTLIDGERVQGGLHIVAKNVVIKNSWISSNFAAGEAANGSGVVNVHPGASLTIEDTRLDGENRTHACIWHEGAALIARRNDCSRVNDGVFVWDAAHFTLEDNYFHALTDQASNGHIDGFQTEGASEGVIRHNTFDIPTAQNACIAIWNGRRDSFNIVVDKNLMAGSGFAVYAEDYSPSEASPQGGYSVTAIRFTNNVFSTRYYRCVGTYGVWYPRGSPTDAWNRTGNRVLETGENVDNANPHDGSRICN